MRPIGPSRWLRFVLVAAAVVGGAMAQPRVVPSVDPVLRTLHTLAVDKRAQLEAKQRESATTKDATRLQVLTAEIDTLHRELLQFERDFEATATGVDLDLYADRERERFDLNKEVQDLLRPLLRLLKTATEDPRQVEQMRSDLDFYSQRAELAKQAVSAIRNRLRAFPDGELELRARLAAELAKWESNQVDAQNRATLASQRLESRLAQRKSLLDSTKLLLGGFFKERGLNLLLAVAAFFAVFVGCRWLFRFAQRFAGERDEVASLRRRLAAVLYHTLVSTASAGAALLVLYAQGDWLLLGLAIVMLLGIVWAGKSWLPRFFEELKMLLNLGPVREKERLIYAGLPWRVEALNLNAVLLNPALTGGELRLPLRDLVGLRSRSCHAAESWFPCREGDVVMLSDGTRGRVLLQTPECVEVLAGGSKTTYRTTDFLGLTPKNLSERFAVTVVFGIDYKHQAISTTEVPSKMRARVEHAVRQVVPAATVLAVRADLQQCGPSSIDYEVSAELTGQAASEFGAVQRAMQRALVELCTEEGWGIPFPTMTIHYTPP